MGGNILLLAGVIVLGLHGIPSVQSRALLQNARVGAGSNAGARWRPEIVIGYPLTFNPWKLSVFKGTFEVR